MYGVQIFNNPDFGDIRTVIIDGEPWFVSKDIAEKLGYAKTFNMTKQIDKEDKQIFDCSSQEDTNFNAKARRIGIINESGMYTAIMGSQLKAAKAFKRWVTSEVLPSIRRTGTYGQPQLPQTTDGKIALLAQGHTELKAEVDSIREDLEALKMDLPIFPVEADRITKEVRKRGVEILGGKQSAAYQNKGLRTKLYTDLYTDLKHNFNVRSYKSIRRCDCEKAIEIVQGYKPPIYLEREISEINSRNPLSAEGGAR